MSTSFERRNIKMQSSPQSETWNKGGEAFLQLLDGIREGKKFALLLGAGSSNDSGIMLADELAKSIIYTMIKKRRVPEDRNERWETLKAAEPEINQWMHEKRSELRKQWETTESVRRNIIDGEKAKKDRENALQAFFDTSKPWPETGSLEVVLRALELANERPSLETLKHDLAPPSLIPSDSLRLAARVIQQGIFPLIISLNWDECMEVACGMETCAIDTLWEDNPEKWYNKLKDWEPNDVPVLVKPHGTISDYVSIKGTFHDILEEDNYKSNLILNALTKVDGVVCIGWKAMKDDILTLMTKDKEHTHSDTIYMIGRSAPTGDQKDLVGDRYMNHASGAAYFWTQLSKQMEIPPASKVTEQWNDVYVPFKDWEKKAKDIAFQGNGFSRIKNSSDSVEPAIVVVAANPKEVPGKGFDSINSMFFSMDYTIPDTGLKATIGTTYPANGPFGEVIKAGFLAHTKDYLYSSAIAEKLRSLDYEGVSSQSNTILKSKFGLTSILNNELTVSLEELTHSNIVLIGGPDSNRWVIDAAMRMEKLLAQKCGGKQRVAYRLPLRLWSRNMGGQYRADSDRLWHDLASSGTEDPLDVAWLRSGFISQHSLTQTLRYGSSLGHCGMVLLMTNPYSLERRTGNYWCAIVCGLANTGTQAAQLAFLKLISTPDKITNDFRNIPAIIVRANEAVEIEYENGGPSHEKQFKVLDIHAASALWDPTYKVTDFEYWSPDDGTWKPSSELVAI